MKLKINKNGTNYQTALFLLEPVLVSSSVALCEVINLPMPGVFVCERYELMVI